MVIISEESTLIEIGKRIMQVRREKGMTQEQLAEAIGLSTQSISCIELGKKAIRAENLINICRALEISADYVLFGKMSADRTKSLYNSISCLDENDYVLIASIINRLARA